jgi:TPR repeat protein
MTRFFWCGAAGFAVALLALPAHAQDNQDLQMLRRPSEAFGLEGLQLDLTQPAARRYALVIGNGDYDHATGLPNAVADANLVAGMLRQSGYIVQAHTNLDKRGFESALRQLLVEAGKGAEVIIYYAGHGVQIGSSNQLIPVDAQITSVYDVPFETVSLSSVLAIAGARARSLVVILDSCRDNPFPGQGGIVGLDSVPQDMRTGFAAQDTPVNSLVVFSTSPGARAFDGDGPNSPFTQALFDIATASPDVSLDQVMRDVRRRVYEKTYGLQVPWESSSLVEEVTLGLSSDPAMMLLADTAPMTADATQGDPIAISLPLDEKVMVGEALQPLIGTAPEGLMLTAAPQAGRLELELGAQTRGLTMVPVETDQLPGLIYSGGQVESSALSLPSQQITDSFDILSENTLQTVQLTLDVDPCDFQAGDYLDPEGVGVARYPNEIQVVPALAACQAAVIAQPDNGRFFYELGRVQVAMRDLDGAEVSFTRAMALDHTRAFVAMGLLDMRRQQETQGSTRIAASPEALALLAQGVDRGDPYAFHALGIQLLDFGTDDVQKRQGFALLTRAMEMGHTFSMNSLGRYFLVQDSDHFDPLRGVRYLQESAARGDIYGFANMGFVAQNGAGDIAPDPVAALDWYKRASDQGHPSAPTSIGRMYFRGFDGQEPDYGQALQWYDLGLSRGDSWGGANGAATILNQQPAGYDLADAGVRAAKSAALGNAGAAEAAATVLAALPADVLAQAADQLAAEIRAGDPTAPDADIAPVVAQLDTVLASPATDPVGRLRDIAALFWASRALRVDLF